MSSGIPINQQTNITDTLIQGYCKNKCKLRYNYPDVNAACVMIITPDSELDILTPKNGLNYPGLNAITTNSDLRNWMNNTLGKNIGGKIHSWTRTPEFKTHMKSFGRDTPKSEIVETYNDKDDAKLIDHKGNVVRIKELLLVIMKKQESLINPSSEQSQQTQIPTNTYLSIKLDDLNQTHSVSFNGLGYNENEIRIYSPSLHMFNKKRADMEVCISHKQSGGLPEKLLICVPFMKSTGIVTTMTEASNMISNIFSSHGGCYKTPKLTSKPFNLNTILPQKPYFYYKNEKKEHIVCFHTTVENIIPSNIDLSILNREISVDTNTAQQSTNLFFSGEQLSERSDDDIYIEVKVEGFNTMNRINNLVTAQNIICGLLLGGIVFSGYKIITSGKKKM